MKMRTVSIMLVVVILALGVGCNAKNTEPKRKEAYVTLHNLMIEPQDLEQSGWVDRKVNFSTFVISNAFETEITTNGKMKAQTFHYATISRNVGDALLLNVTDLDETLKAGEYYTVKGKISGYVTFEERNQKESQMLEIKVSSFKVLEHSDEAENTSDTLQYDDGDLHANFVFKKAVKDTDHNDDFIALHFEFTNTGEKAITPPLKMFDILQGDELLQRDSLLVNGRHTDPDAIALSQRNTVQPGETVYYYCSYVVFDGSEFTDEDIIVFLSDDDFNIIYEHSIPLEFPEGE